MRLPVIIMLVVIAVNCFVDGYIWRRITEACRRRWPGVAYAWSSLLLFIYIIVVICLPRRSGDDSMLVAIMWMVYGYFSIYIPKYIYVIFSVLDYVPRLWRKSRCGAGSWIGAILGVAAFVILWWSALVNRESYQIREVELTFDNLPEQFDGYSMVQFSDAHVGTYGNDTTFISEVVDVINGQGADVIFFTGDIVNRRTAELTPFRKTLSRLSAPDGVYSILGNHDYGDYISWPDDASKAANMKLMRDYQRDMGWTMLNNDSRYIYRYGDSIALVGVENVGDPPFTVYGDLAKAYPQLSDSVFKVLLTHNPAHWTSEIADKDSINVDLSLSGHTHAMQCQVGNWSPAQWRYQTWGGLYEDKSNRHKLYVNIGLGTVAVPARIGATPEITVITLKKAGQNQ